MPPVDPNEKQSRERTNGNGSQRFPHPRYRFAGFTAPDPAAESVAAPPEGAMEGPRDVDELMGRGEEGSDGVRPSVPPEGASPPRGAGRPEQPPDPWAELMPRRRSARASGDSERTRKGKSGRGAAARVSRPHGAREAAREERQAIPDHRAEEAERRRSLPARRAPAERGGTYVMGTANPCRSCGMAVWVAGKDAHGRWIKVNLDGSAHICGAPMTGLGWAPPPFMMPQQPMLMAGAPQPYVPGQPMVPGMQPPVAPVADQGRVWVERFMVVVASVALIFLATIPREGPNGGAASRPQAAQGPAQRIAAPATAPGAGALPAVAAPARPDPPRKETFSLGSTEDDVMSVMGPPREIYDNRWWYGSSYVDFGNGRVVNFYNSIHGELKVKMQGAARNRPAFLTKGLSKDEVLHLQGTPSRLAGNRWYFGSSYVDFREDRVADYFNGVLRELKIPARSTAQ